MMHRESCMCGMDNLELFQVPPTNIALEDSKWMEYYPISSTLQSDTAPIEFDIQGQGDEYIDLSQTYLQIVCKFTKSDGSALTGATANSTPVNNIIHSLFSEIDVTLNGKVISPGTDTYLYKAYLEKLLSYRPETLVTQMKACSLWEKDTPGHMDDTDVTAATQTKTKDGYTLWCIDFTKDQEAQLDKFHLIETGNLRIEVQFAENTADTLNCLVYAEFDNLLEINKQREVSIDY